LAEEVIEARAEEEERTRPTEGLGHDVPGSVTATSERVRNAYPTRLLPKRQVEPTRDEALLLEKLEALLGGPGQAHGAEHLDELMVTEAAVFNHAAQLLYGHA
jgi:hypothetical protein